MKKFYKVVLIIAAILMVAGIGLGVGTYLVVTKTEWTDVLSSLGSYTYTFDGYDEITELKINSTYSDVEFVSGDFWAVQFEDVYIPMAEADVNGSVLSISLKTPVDITAFDWNIGVMPDFDFEVSPKVRVIFPKDIELSSTNVQCGVGNIDFASLHSDWLVAQSAFGKIDLNNAVVSQSGAIQTVLGKIEKGNNSLLDTSINFKLW